MQEPKPRMPHPGGFNLARAICEVFGIDYDESLQDAQKPPSPAGTRGVSRSGKCIVTGSFWHPSRLN